MSDVATTQEFESFFGKVEIVSLNDDQSFVKDLIEKNKFNVTQTIRYLNAEGWKRSRIAKAMPNYSHGGSFRYQHVKNVLDQQAKKTDSK